MTRRRRPRGGTRRQRQHRAQAIRDAATVAEGYRALAALDREAMPPADHPSFNLWRAFARERTRTD